MKTTITALVILLGVFTLPAPVVENPSFEPPPWTVFGDDIDHFQDGKFTCIVEGNGTAFLQQEALGIRQGMAYTCTFEVHLYNPDSYMRVFFGDTTLDHASDPQLLDRQGVYTFHALGGKFDYLILEMDNQGADDAYFVIDNVTLVETVRNAKAKR